MQSVPSMESTRKSEAAFSGTVPGEVEHIGVCAAGVLEAAPAGAQADLIQTAVDAVHDLIKDQRDGHPVAGLIGGLCHGGNAQELGLHGVIDLDMMLYLLGCPFVAAGSRRH